MIQSQKNRRFIRAAEQAKMVRAALKQAFPGFKFDSVRSQTYTGGGAINVDWTDGPTKPEVDAIVQKFRGGDFNAMEDLKTSHTSEINGEEVSFHCDYIFTERQAGIAWHGKLIWHRMRGRTVVPVELGTERAERIILEKTQEIFATPEFRRTIIVRIPRPEVFEWLQHNATADIEYLTAPGYAAMFVFKNKNDAFAFKVRWF